MRATLEDISSRVRRADANEFKHGRESFTRDGKLSPDLVISLLVYMAADGGRRGYQHILDGFWDEAKANHVPLPVNRPVSGAAFCNARKRLCSSAVRHLLRDTADGFESLYGQGFVDRIPAGRFVVVDTCGPPRFLVDPCARAPCSLTPVGGSRQAVAALAYCLAYLNSLGSHWPYLSRGSIARLTCSLSTLRHVRLPARVARLASGWSPAVAG